MTKIAYIPFSKYYFNTIYDLRNVLLYAKLKKINIEVYDENKNYDLIVLPPSYDPTDKSIFKKNHKIIYQLVDNYLSKNTYSLNNILKGVVNFFIGRGKKLTLNYKYHQENICKLSNAVICSSTEQKKQIDNLNSNCHIFFEGNFHISKSSIKRQNSNKVNLVWEGRAENITGFSEFVKAFNILSNKFDINLHIITDLSYPLFSGLLYRSTQQKIKKIFKKHFNFNTAVKNSNIYLYQWNKATVSNIIKTCDIAVIPMDTKNKFLYGKSMNKLIVFWRNNIPTLCSNISSYHEISRETQLDICCNSTDEWVSKISNLVINKTYYNHQKEVIYKYINDNYSEKSFVKQWDNLVESVLNE